MQAFWIRDIAHSLTYIVITKWYNAFEILSPVLLQSFSVFVIGIVVIAITTTTSRSP